ncbi:C4-dicarboxylate ABC transporter [Streptomyces sp. TLI_171]|uniref:SLAC1 family transporter n=1 Tax=Streptomyces sp. TLI_171 TaxID=1938859 RepID=UPI000C17F70A|nr:C4-dicarboxylate ABC transporter [Streptomyces sp. TLI_171]RKE20203.1 C4-dicarboxylate transporter/malic acid transport protein [Streptomyces sp. TLI_171]
MATLLAPRSRLRTLDLARLGPNWYAAVMGTAITGNAAAALPVDVPGRAALAEAVWTLSLLLLAVLLPARAAHLVRHREQARRTLLEDPAAAVFYGCPPMALLAVGYGALTVGGPVLGPRAGLALDVLLWTAGTGYALLVAAGLPYLMITRHRLSALEANPTWLLPVVAPMVSAALGPALVPHLPEGAARQALLYGCVAMFGASLLATLALLPVVLGGLLHGRRPAPVLTPSLFLVLGPLGQSTTAVHQFADAVPLALPGAGPGGAAAARGLAEVYGIAVMGFALLWLAVAVAANLRAMRAEMPFAMTWWAFTFPVGTLVTGAAALARHTGFGGFAALAAALYLLLFAAWSVAAARTATGLLAGRLL